VAEPRQTYREQAIQSIGGWSGMVVTAVPTVVFVAVNAVTGLRTAVIAAIAAAVLLTGYRLVRRQPVQQAISGLFGVLIAALIAARTGQARGYFLLGIWMSFAYAAVFVSSMAVRRPIVGVAWEYLDPTPGDERPWHRRPPLLRAYLLATAAASVVFLARGVVQLALFQQNATGWLAVARIAMGFPLYIAAVGFGFWVISRARKRISEPQATP
jgi:Protein of unknown function (DUF3159)